jgi:hypothetical protein
MTMSEKIRSFAPIIELVSGIAVLVTLIVLVVEVRTNTQAVRLQATEYRSTAFLLPLINPETLPSLYAKVKEVDGLDDRTITAMMERYEMTVEEAIQWTRFMGLNWSVIEYEYAANGPSVSLNSRIRGFLNATDLRLHFDNSPRRLFDNDFREYVESMIQESRNDL